MSDFSTAILFWPQQSTGNMMHLMKHDIQCENGHFHGSKKPESQRSNQCITKHLNYDFIPADKRSVFPVEGDVEHRNVSFVHNSIFCCIKETWNLYETPDNENTTKMPDDKQTVQISL